ncbi:Putative Piso0_000048 protein [Rhizopus microsporus]|nr:Putative Piso0_000048 protein [Rhizopus microsporus]
MTTHCNLSIRQAQFQPVERNSEEKIQQRYDWVQKWQQTDLDFTINCVFLDELALHINLKRGMAWSKKGSPAIVTVPITKANATSTLGAISAIGLINVSLRVPKRIKKRKLGSVTDGYSTGTVTGHYLSFVKMTLDEMDKHSEMKRHYLVMDNAPIHSSADIGKYIHSRGYRFVYLPPYSPELNPIEQFWSVVKSKVK